MGSFATSNQAFSSVVTLIILNLIILNLYLNNSLITLIILASCALQIIIEYKFLVFSKKYFGLKMFFFSLFGIQVINLGIILGAIYFCLNKIKNIFKKPFTLKFYSLIKEYFPNDFRTLKYFLYLLFFEIYYLFKGYKQSSITILNHYRFTDNIPCQYYFLHKILKFLKKNNIKSLVDLGCGGGRSLYFFNKKLKINYYGVEHNFEIFQGCKNLLNKFENIKIYNDDFMSYKFLDFKAECYFINDPLKDKNEFYKLITNILNTMSKKIIYFVLIDVDENKLKIFDKYKKVKIFKYKSKGYYIYSNEKTL